MTFTRWLLCPVALIAGLAGFGAPALAQTQGIDLSIQRGQVARFLGPSGAGKTTVMTILAGPIGVVINPGEDGGLYGDFTRRRILVLDERNREAVDLGAMARMANAMGGIGGSSANSAAIARLTQAQEQMMAQIPQMLEGVPADQQAQARLAIEQALGLTGGSQTRTAIARPLIADPEILILDEPTADVGGFEVRVVESRIDGVLVRRVQLADFDDVPGGQEVMDALAELNALYEEISGGPIPDGGFMAELAWLSTHGFPVEIHFLDTDETWELDSVIARDLDPDAFEPPSGYRRR